MVSTDFFFLVWHILLIFFNAYFPLEMHADQICFLCFSDLLQNCEVIYGSVS